MAKRGGAIGRIADHVITTLFRKVPRRVPEGTIARTADSLPTPRTREEIVAAGKSKLPSSWGEGRPNAKKVGQRWEDPQNPQGNRVRIDQGDPSNPQSTQQIDHVQVNSNGRVIGRDGQPITGTVKENYEQAHVPLDDWLGWQEWNRP